MILRKRKHPPRESSDAREALVDAAVRIVNDEGRQFDARSVAKEAGRSLGTLTHHFRDGGLQELRGAVALRGFQMLSEAVRAELAEAGDPEKCLRRIALTYARFAMKHPRLYRTMYGDEWGEAVNEAQVALGAIVAEQIAKCQRDGILRSGPVERIARSGRALLHGIALMQLEGHVPADEAESFAQETIDDLFDGLRARD